MKSAYSKSEFKNQCLKVLDQVAKKGQSVIVTKRGIPIVKIIPVESSIPQASSLEGTLMKGFALKDFEFEEKWEANSK